LKGLNSLDNLKVAVRKCHSELIGLMTIENVDYGKDTILFYGKIPIYSDEIANTIVERITKLGYDSKLESSNGRFLLKVKGSFKRLKEPKPLVNILLFCVAFFTMMLAGATWAGADLLNEFHKVWDGFPFALALSTILLFHEYGHFFASKFHGVKITPPYFLPDLLFTPLSLFGFPIPTIGTFGAFIKMRSPMTNRKSLLDIGAAGPIAGFIPAIFFIIYGFTHLPGPEFVDYVHRHISPEQLAQVGPTLTLGNSLIFNFLSSTFVNNSIPMSEIYHYPFIFAGWVGLLVTALNMLPIGQLDGGHIVYALFGSRKHIIIAKSAFASVIVLGIALNLLNYPSVNWFLWAALIFFLIRVKHPPIANELMPLSDRRKMIGLISLSLFVFSFTPIPLYYG